MFRLGMMPVQSLQTLSVLRFSSPVRYSWTRSTLSPGWLSSSSFLALTIVHRSVVSVSSAFFAATEEERMENVLRRTLEAAHVRVSDISGGCGSMYSVEVHSHQFVGKKLVDQHRLVTDALKSEIASMHGLVLKTRATTSIPSREGEEEGVFR